MKKLLFISLVILNLQQASGDYNPKTALLVDGPTPVTGAITLQYQNPRFCNGFNQVQADLNVAEGQGYVCDPGAGIEFLGSPMSYCEGYNAGAMMVGYQGSMVNCWTANNKTRR